MQITLKITFGTVGTEGLTREEIVKALCEQFQSGGDVMFVINGIEYSAIAQDAEEMK